MAGWKTLLDEEGEVETLHDGLVRLYANGSFQIGDFWYSKGTECALEGEGSTARNNLDGLHVEHCGTEYEYRFRPGGWFDRRPGWDYLDPDAPNEELSPGWIVWGSVIAVLLILLIAILFSCSTEATKW